MPIKIASSFQSFSVTVDSYVGIKFDRILLEAVVFTPLVQNKSLTAIGAPTNALSSFLLVSIFLALLTAFSKSFSVKAV